MSGSEVVLLNLECGAFEAAEFTGNFKLGAVAFNNLREVAEVQV
jgi:hypothetical protein